MLAPRYGVLKPQGGTPPAAPNFVAWQYKISPDLNGFGTDSVFSWEYHIYSYNGQYSTGFADSGGGFYDSNNDNVDVAFAHFIESDAGLYGNNDFMYTIQTEVEDAFSNLGYVSQTQQEVNVMTDITNATAVQVSGSGYSNGNVIQFRAWAEWSAGNDYVGQNVYVFPTVIMVGSGNVQFDWSSSGVSGITTPNAIYIERNLNGGGWNHYARFTWTDSSHLDQNNEWSSGTITHTVVIYRIDVYMFGTNFPTTVQYLAERYIMDSGGQFLPGDAFRATQGNTLGTGFVDLGDWTNGTQGFQPTLTFGIYNNWTSVSGCTYRLRRFNDQVPVDFPDQHQDTASTTFTDYNTGWVAG